MVATTRVVSAREDPITSLGADDFVWFHQHRGFAAVGAAAFVSPAMVSRVLAQVEVDDRVREPGTGAIACGALPFADPASGRLVIPQHVLGVTRGGAAWETRIVLAPGAEREPSGDGLQLDRSEGSGRARPAPADGASSDPVDGVWAENVNAALAHITAGDVSKVVLSREVFYPARTGIDRRDIVAHLVASHPNCYVYAAPPRLVGASPELLLERNETHVLSRPLAGTVCADKGGFDKARLDSFLSSRKEMYEHQVVVDAVVDTLSRHCIHLQFADKPSVERFKHVAHLATTVTGSLDKGGPSALELALLLHPTPAVCGSPMRAARSIIARLEDFDRGLFAGPVGWVNRDGEGEWAIALRGAEVEGATARLWAGAGIVAGSEPKTEWAEIEGKLATMRDALRRSEAHRSFGVTEEQA
jgi:menaquinone-specific isochorismate synthase